MSKTSEGEKKKCEERGLKFRNLLNLAESSSISTALQNKLQLPRTKLILDDGDHIMCRLLQMLQVYMKMIRKYIPHPGLYVSVPRTRLPFYALNRVQTKFPDGVSETASEIRWFKCTSQDLTCNLQYTTTQDYALSHSRKLI